MDNFRIEKNILVKYTGDASHVVIPEGVRAIGAQAFAFNTVIESVKIPKGVLTIGERAFDHCQNLVSVDVPKTVTLIENNAFSTCKKLENITLPEGVPFIAAKTFYMCLSLKSLTLPVSVTSIGDEAFARCIALEEMAIGDEVLEIGEKAFMECYGLKKLSIGRGVEVLKWNTFAYCKTLEKVAFTTALRQIEYGAFDSCPEITDLYFDEDEERFSQIHINKTRNETLLRASRHFNYTESILSISVPSLVEEVVTEIIEEPAVIEETPVVEETVVTDEAGQLSFAVVEELPIVSEEETSEAAEVLDEKPYNPTPAEQVALPIDTPAQVEETAETAASATTTATASEVTATATTRPVTPKKPLVRMTPKSAQSTVSEEFKAAFYETFLGNLGDNVVAYYRSKAEGMSDEDFEIRSEALFLVPVDDAYEFGCICLVMGKHNWAFRSFLSAAGKGHPYAQYYVGACFLFGIDTTKKIVDAARWLTKCKKDKTFGADAERLLVIVDEELDKPENAGLKVKRGNK